MNLIHLKSAKAQPELLAAPLQWSLDLWGEGKAEFTAADWQNFYIRVLQSDYELWDITRENKELLYLALREETNEVVGVIGLCDFDDLEEFRHLKPWICAFVVREDLRGIGIGTQIIQEIEKLIIEFKIPEIYLWTEQALGFYLKLGYRKIDELNKENRKIHILSKSFS